MSWFEVIKRKNTKRKKLSLNRRPKTGPVSFTNERQKTKERRDIQDMVNSSGKEQPRNVMNQKGREQTPQEERNQYEHALEEGIDDMNYVDDDIFQEWHPMYDKDMNRLGRDEYLRQNPHLRGRLK